MTVHGKILQRIVILITVLIGVSVLLYSWLIEKNIVTATGGNATLAQSDQCTYFEVSNVEEKKVYFVNCGGMF